MRGCSFCRACGVIGSPNRKAAVNSVVANAELPAPITRTLSLVRMLAVMRRRTAGTSHGLTSSVSSRCSQNTTASAG